MGTLKKGLRENDMVRQSKPLDFFEQRILRPLPDGAVRLQFVDAPDTYVVVVYPGLLPLLRQLDKREMTVEFKVACALWGGKAQWFTIRSIAGVDLENIASKDGWMEALGNKDHVKVGGAGHWR